MRPLFIHGRDPGPCEVKGKVADDLGLDEYGWLSFVIKDEGGTTLNVTAFQPSDDEQKLVSYSKEHGTPMTLTVKDDDYDMRLRVLYSQQKPSGGTISARGTLEVPVTHMETIREASRESTPGGDSTRTR